MGGGFLLVDNLLLLAKVGKELLLELHAVDLPHVSKDCQVHSVIFFLLLGSVECLAQHSLPLLDGARVGRSDEVLHCKGVFVEDGVDVKREDAGRMRSRPVKGLGLALKGEITI